MKKFVKKLIALTLLTTMTISSLTIHANAQIAGSIVKGSQNFTYSWTETREISGNGFSGELTAIFVKNGIFSQDKTKTYSNFKHDSGVHNNNGSKWGSFKADAYGTVSKFHPSGSGASYLTLIYQ